MPGIKATSETHRTAVTVFTDFLSFIIVFIAFFTIFIVFIMFSIMFNSILNLRKIVVGVQKEDEKKKDEENWLHFHSTETRIALSLFIHNMRCKGTGDVMMVIHNSLYDL